eukprot:1278951-Pyramimonas_sp.AAC.1
MVQCCRGVRLLGAVLAVASVRGAFLRWIGRVCISNKASSSPRVVNGRCCDSWSCCRWWSSRAALSARSVRAQASCRSLGGRLLARDFCSSGLERWSRWVV